MGYWEGKCFMCLFWGTLAAIVALSAPQIYNDVKSAKKKNKIEKIQTQYQDSL